MTVVRKYGSSEGGVTRNRKVCDLRERFVGHRGK